VFAISSPEILEIRTVELVLTGAAVGERTHHWIGVSINERNQWTRFPTIGFVPHVKDSWTIPPAILLCQKFGNFVMS
jgi:hypothetical protein